MKKSHTILLSLFLFCAPFYTEAQSTSTVSAQTGWVDSTLFSPKLFIENKGQFDNAPYLSSMPILYGVRNGNTKIFFSKNKIAYTLHKTVKNEKIFKEFQREESKKHTSGLESEEEIKHEQRLKSNVFKTITKVIRMEWLGANEDCMVEATDMASEYFSYGMDEDIRHDIERVHAYKKITYKNIYDGIDIEYSFHPKTGIKYNIIVHPGADISKVKLKYSGADDISLDAENNVIIETEIGNIIDHAPVSFQNSNKTKIQTKFILNDNVLGFQTDKYDHSRSMVIDPWLTNTVPQIDTAYEIAVDPNGNVFVFGDYNSQIVKYNSSGVLQWSFLAGPGWINTYSTFGGDITVDPSGNCYCSGQGDLRKVSAAGTSVWLYTTIINITNISCCELGWRMVYDPNNNLLYGGGSNGQCKATTYDPATGNPSWIPNGWNACAIITPPCPSACPNSNGEIRHMTLAPNGNLYAYTAVGDGFGGNDVSTITGFNPALTGVYRDCSVPSSPYWIGGTYFNGCYYMGNGIAASNCFIYIYTGNEVHKYDIFNPTFLGSTTIANGVNVMNSGILADVCNNFYVGTQTGISAYGPGFNLITSVNTPKPVFDMAFAPGNTIAACGIGFVGVFANVQQTGTPVTCTPPPNLPMTATGASTPSNGCNSNNASAWVDTIMYGNAPYSYLWSNGATTSTISNLAPGTYTCVITDSSCPQETTTITVTIPPTSGPTATTSSTSILCFGGSASSTVNVTGGIGPYTYTWSNAQTNATATNLTAGNYTIVVTDANGCTSSQTVTITQPTVLSVAITPNPVSCNGGTNGSAVATSAGGTSPYSYAWSNAQTTATATNLSAGTYTVVITDANGCTSSQTVIITQPTALSLSTTSTNSLCTGNTGTASVAASGGTGTYSYMWTPSAQTTSTATGLGGGTYTVTVTDQNGCTQNAIASVLSSSGVTVTSTSANVLCHNGNDGSATVTASGGTPPYTYLWSNAQTNATATNLIAGIYTVIVTDANGCSTTQSISITQPVALLVTASGTPNQICVGQSVNINSIVSGGSPSYIYSWNSGQTNSSITVTPTTSTAYSLTVTDANGCTQQAIVSIVVNPLPLVNFAAPDTSGCGNLCVTFTNNSTNASTFSWDFGDGNTSTQSSPTHCYITPGNYNVTLTVTSTGGCSSSLTLSNYIHIFPVPTASFTVSPTTASILEPTIHFTDQSTGASTWLWNFGDQNNSGSVLQNPTFTYSDSGRFCTTLFVTNQYGCVDTSVNCVEITPEFAFFAPNAFTPNSNGPNNGWTPKGVGIDPATYKLMVFDRWGNLIWKSENWGEEWDGRANGGSEIAQIDVYVWKCSFHDLVEGKSHQYIGHVSLIK